MSAALDKAVTALDKIGAEEQQRIRARELRRYGNGTFKGKCPDCGADLEVVMGEDAILFVKHN